MTKFFPAEILSKEEVSKIVIDNRDMAAKIPEELTFLHAIWEGKGPMEIDDKDIDYAAEEIFGYLKMLGIDEEKLISLQNDGLLRKQMKDLKPIEPHNVLLFMKEIIDYSAFLSTLPKNVANNICAEFPAGMRSGEYACIEGGRERLTLALRKLKASKVKPFETAVVTAHDIVSEKARQRFASKITHGGMPIHLISGIDFLFDTSNSTQGMAKTTAAMVPLELAWDKFYNYIPDLNEALQEISRADDIRNMMKRNPDPTANWNKIGGELEARNIPFGKLFDSEERKVITDGKTKVKYFSHWNKDGIEEIFPLVRVNPSHDLPLPRSLFDLDAPKKIVDLVLSENPENRQIGVKALRMLGDQNQVGGSPIQFFNCIDELGKRNNPEEKNLDIGLATLSSLEIEGNVRLNQDIAEVLRSAEYYRERPLEKDNISSYIGFLEGKNNEVRFGDLIRGNTPDTEKLIARIGSSAQRDFGQINLDRIMHHPNRMPILDSLFQKAFEIRAEIATAGQNLVFHAAQFRDTELLQHMLKLKNREKKVGEAWVKEGLNKSITMRSIDGREYKMRGFDYLFEYDPKLLKGIIGEGEGRVGSDFLFRYGDFRGNNIVYHLAKDGKFSDLEVILSMCGQRAESLLNQRKNENTALHSLVMDGNHHAVNLMTKKDEAGRQMLHPDISNNEKRTPILLAVTKDDVKMVGILLANGADLEKPSNSTLISYAVRNNKIEMLQLFFSQKDENQKPKYSINSYHGTYESPLCEVAKTGNIEVMKLLLENGADPSTSANFHANAKMVFNVVEKGHVEMLRFLLTDENIKSKLTLNIKVNSQNTPLSEAIDRGEFEMAEMLIQNQAKLSKGDLTRVIKTGNIPMMNLVLAQKNREGKSILNVNDIDNNGLIEALRYNQPHCAKVLVEEAGANPLQVIDNRGRTVLHHLIENVDVLRAALPENNISSANRLNVDITDQEGATPLMFAAMRGNLPVVRTLLKAGAHDLRLFFPHFMASQEVKDEIDKYRILKMMAERIVKSASKKCESGSSEIVVGGVAVDPKERLKEVERAVYHQLIKSYSDENFVHLMRDNGRNNVRNGDLVEAMSDKLAQNMKRHDEGRGMWKKTKAYEFNIETIYGLFPDRDSILNDIENRRELKPQRVPTVTNFRSVIPEKSSSRDPN